MSLELSGVTKQYDVRERTPVPAVRDVSLTIEPGTFCTLLGPSGCGKTTLLRLIAGFEHATAGEIRHHGRVINDVPPYRRGFPLVFQSYALFPHMTVRENVAYGLRLRKVGVAGLRSRVDAALALLGLDDLRDRFPAQVSGGQQQRVALARALVLEPEIILLDEPLSNLDAALRVAMRAEIRALQQRLGITAIYVTHDQEEALAISDVVVVLNAGSIEQIGPPADVYHRPATRFVARFMGARNIVPVASAGAGLITLLGHDYAAQVHERAPTHAVIRSDALSLSGDALPHQADVVAATFLGAHIQYTLRLADGTSLVLELPSTGMALRVGQRVRFSIRPERLHFLGSET